MWRYPRNLIPNGIHTSPVGAIPKRNKPGKYQLIMALSSPKNSSVNDGIDPTLSSLSYAFINHLSVLIQSLGRGAMLVKVDIKETYRMTKIPPRSTAARYPVGRCCLHRQNVTFRPPISP